MESDNLMRVLYDRLGVVLRQGDDAFIERGPPLVKEFFLGNPEVLDDLRIKPATNGYTRAKVIGDKDKHVIRFMEWAPDCYLLPHEHHGRPCFEFLVEGQLVIHDFVSQEIEDSKFMLKLIRRYVAKPGDFAVVDPRVTEIHSVLSNGTRSRSLHFYPEDNYFTSAYVETRKDVYHRKRLDLRDD